MSRERESAQAADGTPEVGEQALSVLRSIWTARQQSGVDIDERDAKVCKNTAKLGFHVGDDEEGQEIRAAWRAKLEREGKLSADASSVRDLVLGNTESPHRS